MLKLKNKKILITGVSSGLGLEMAKIFASQNNQVDGVARREDILATLRDENILAHYFVGDVSEKSFWKSMPSDHEYDLVIANAGMTYPVKPQIPDFRYTEKMIQVNLLGVLYTFEYALHSMLKKRSGHLVAISSIAAFNGLPGVSGYSASKSALEKLCESFQVDLVDYGIDVSCVFPGFFKTKNTLGNHHPIPFCLETDKAAHLVIKGIEKKKKRIYFPWFFTSVVRLLGILPRPLYRLLMKIDLLNFSKKGDGK